jgi:hypothetical protein
MALPRCSESIAIEGRDVKVREVREGSRRVLERDRSPAFGVAAHCATTTVLLEEC